MAEKSTQSKIVALHPVTHGASYIALHEDGSLSSAILYSDETYSLTALQRVPFRTGPANRYGVFNAGR